MAENNNTNELNTRGYSPSGSSNIAGQSTNVLDRIDDVEKRKRNLREQDKELEKGFLESNVPATIDGRVNPDVDYKKIFTGTSGTDFYNNPNFKKDIETATTFNSNITFADYYQNEYKVSRKELENSINVNKQKGTPITREGRPINIEDLDKPLSYTMLPVGYQPRLDFMIEKNIIKGTAADGAGLEFPLNKQVAQFSDYDPNKSVFEASSTVGADNEFFTTDPKQGAKRLFGLLKKGGMSDTKAAQFAMAQSNGTLEEFRRKNNLTDMFSFFGNVGMAMSEGIQNFLINNKDVFPTAYSDTVGGYSAGPFGPPVVERDKGYKGPDKKIMYERIKYASEVIADKMKISVDDANLVLGYSPDFITRISREVQPSIAFGGMVTVAGSFRAMRESARFRNFVKDKYKGNTYEDSLNVASTKFKLNEADIVEEYFKDRLRIPIFMNYRKNGVLERLNTASEIKASGQILTGGKGLALGRINDLESRKKSISDQIKELKTNRTISGINSNVDSQVSKLTSQMESLDSQIFKTKLFNFVPKYWRSAVTDEIGVATGIATASQLWQNNSEDVNDMTLPLIELMGGVSGSTGVRLTTNSAARLIDDTADFFKFVFAGPDTVGAKDFWKYIFKDKRMANKAYAWIGNAPPEIQKSMFEGIQNQKALVNELGSLTITRKDGTEANLIEDPTILNKALYKLMGLTIVDAVGESLQQTMSTGDVSKFSSSFIEMSNSLKQRTNLYTDLALALEKLQAAKFHPDASKELAQQIKTLENSMSFLKQGIDENRKFVTDYVDTYEEFLMAKLSGVPMPSQMKTGTTTQDYKNEMKLIDRFRINQMAEDGVELEVIQTTMSKKLAERAEKLKTAGKFTESYLSGNDNNANIISGQFENIKSGYYTKADAAFTVLRRDFGEESGRNIYMDGTNILNSIRGDEEKLFDMEDLKDYLPTNHHKKLAGFKADQKHSKAALLLFENAASRFFKNTQDQGIKKLYKEMREAENGDKLTDFEIWETVSDYVDPASGNGFDISLPISMDEWYAMAQAFSRAAYNAKGTRGGLTNRSIYQIAQEDAEDVAFGFKANYFEKPIEMGDEVMKRWKDAKGLWHDAAFRYKTNKYGAKIGKVRGVDVAGGIEYETHPSKWFDEILNPLTKNPNIDANTLDTTVMSKLAQTFGGQPVFDEAGNISRYVFKEDSPGLEYVKSQLIRYGKMKLLNSRAGVILRDGLKKKGLDHNIVPDADGLTGADKQFENLVSNLSMLKLDVAGKDDLNVIDVGQIWKIGGVDHAGIFDDAIVAQVKTAQNDIKKSIDNFKDKSSKLFDEVDGQIDATKYLVRKNTSGEEIYKTLSKGQVGIDELEQSREVYKAAIIEELYKNGDKGISFDKPSGTYRMLDDRIKNIIEKRLTGYDKALAASTMEYVLKNVSEQNRTVGASVTTGMAGNLHEYGTNVFVEKEVNGRALLQMLGADNIKGSPQVKALNTGIRYILNRGSGDDRAYDIISKIGAYMSGEQLAKFPIKLRNIPRSLSVESWISRIYAINRNVVSPKYVATEAIVQSYRTRSYNAFKDMIENPDIGDLVLKMLEEGKPPKGKEAIRFYRLLVSAASRNDYIASQTNEDVEKLREEVTNDEESRLLNTIQQNRVVEPKEEVAPSFFGDMFNKVKTNTNSDELALAGSGLL